MPQEIKTIALGFVNSYLVQTGDGFILFDTGIPGSRATIEKALTGAGCKPGNLKLIIFTHGDVDHTGSGAYLAKKFAAKTAIHRGDADMVITGKPGPERKITSLPMRVMMKLAKAGARRSGTKFETFRPDIYLEDGQSLGEFGFDAVVMHIPGHTAGSIAVLSADGALFSGDTFQNYRNPGGATIISNEVELAASIARMKKSGAKMVYPGHGKPFEMSRLR